MEATTRTSPNEGSPSSSSSKKRGVLGRLFRKSSPHKSDKRSPSPQCLQDVALPRDSPPPEMHPGKTSHKPLTEPQNNPRRAVKPPASEAAFRGPPRYNWMDIETAAAVKVQAAYRRTLVMNRLEEEGCSTSAIRNRARRRQYTLAREAHTVSLFGCCAGPDFSWTDFGNPYDAQREYDKAAYEDKKKAQLEREEELRSTFGQRLRRKKEANKVDEAYEVVE